MLGPLARCDRKADELAICGQYSAGVHVDDLIQTCEAPTLVHAIDRACELGMSVSLQRILLPNEPPVLALLPNVISPAERKCLSLPYVVRGTRSRPAACRGRQISPQLRRRT